VAESSSAGRAYYEQFWALIHYTFEMNSGKPNRWESNHSLWQITNSANAILISVLACSYPSRRQKLGKGWTKHIPVDDIGSSLVGGVENGSVLEVDIASEQLTQGYPKWHLLSRLIFGRISKVNTIIVGEADNWDSCSTGLWSVASSLDMFFGVSLCRCAVIIMTYNIPSSK